MNKLIILFLLCLTACFEQLKDKNNPPASISDITHKESKMKDFVRTKAIDLQSLELNAFLLISQEFVNLDTISGAETIEIEIDVTNIGESALHVQDILLPTPYMKAYPSDFDLYPGDSKTIHIKIKPVNFDGFKSFEVIILNNTLDMEKIVTISGYFNGK